MVSFVATGKERIRDADYATFDRKGASSWNGCRVDGDDARPGCAARWNERDSRRRLADRPHPFEESRKSAFRSFQGEMDGCVPAVQALAVERHQRRGFQPPEAAFTKLPRVESAPLAAIHGKLTARGCLVELPLRPEEQIYGLGLQMLSFAQRGKKKTVRVNADPKFDTGDSHAPVPFYVTTEGVGIFVDTARYATFYLGNARPKPEHAIAHAANEAPDPNYTHNLEERDKGTVTVEVPHVEGVDIY